MKIRDLLLQQQMKNSPMTTARVGLICLFLHGCYVLYYAYWQNVVLNTAMWMTVIWLLFLVFWWYIKPPCSKKEYYGTQFTT